MRGADQQPDAMFSYVSPEQRVPEDHPLRPVRKMANEALKKLSRRCRDHLQPHIFNFRLAAHLSGFGSARRRPLRSTRYSRTLQTPGAGWQTRSVPSSSSTLASQILQLSRGSIRAVRASHSDWAGRVATDNRPRGNGIHHDGPGRYNRVISHISEYDAAVA